MSQITVTIEGPQGSGKTRLAEMLHDALLNAGASMAVNSECESEWQHFGSTIRIIEKQAR